MPEVHEQPSSRRTSVRRQVRLDASVLSDIWDSGVPHLATDLSEDGLWLQSQLPLEAGTELSVSFRPPRWAGDAPLTALAAVARVGMFRRRPDAADSGMGLRFIDLEDECRARLRACLRGLPPPLPGRTASSPPPLRLWPEVPEVPVHDVEEIELTDQDIIVIHGGQEFALQAEGGLLTGGRTTVASVLPPRSIHRPPRPAKLKARRRGRYVDRATRTSLNARTLVRPLRPMLRAV